MPDPTVQTPDEPDRLTDEERDRLIQRDIGTMSRLYEAVADMTARVDLEVFADPGVAEWGLTLSEAIAGRLREVALR